MKDQGKAVIVRGYSIGEMARLYSVTNPTFKKWIKPFLNDIGERKGRFYTIAQTKIIFEKLGMPGSWVLSNEI